METNQNTTAEKETPKFRLNLSIPKRSVWAFLIFIPNAFLVFSTFFTWMKPEWSSARTGLFENLRDSIASFWIFILAVFLFKALIFNLLQIFTSKIDFTSNNVKKTWLFDFLSVIGLLVSLKASNIFEIFGAICMMSMAMALTMFHKKIRF